MEITEVIVACGHENIQATHRSTLQITKEKHLSRSGDCVIAVSANKGLKDLSQKFREGLSTVNSKLTVLIEAGGIGDVVKAFGSPLLTLNHPTDMVVRKSSYICHRTLAICADKSACDLSRKLVQLLKKPDSEVRITLIANV